MSVAYEPFSSAVRRDPYPTYRELRDRDRVHFAPEAGVYCVTRYEDVARVLKQPELYSSSAMNEVLMNADMGPMRPASVWALLRFFVKTRVGPFKLQKAGNLVSSDGARHDAMRAIVNRGFTPRRIAAWESRCREIVSAQLAPLSRGEDFDVIEDLAIPLPVTIISEVLGVEAERRADFKRWSDAIISVASGPAKENPIESGMLECLGELFGYVRGMVARRRREPRDDLISLLVDPGQGDVLSSLDIVQFVVLLLAAGNETTTNLIGNAVNALLDHPESLERVAADPSLVPQLIEETLRYDAPIQLAFRTATREVEIAGTRVPEGAIVMPVLGSANRDERRFDAPDRFDLDRDARGHVGFGFGVHFCLGASLARLEARTALEALVPELPRCKPVGSRSELIDSFLVRGRRAIQLAPALPNADG